MRLARVREAFEAQPDGQQPRSEQLQSALQHPAAQTCVIAAPRETD
jgi:hypothetical protein